MRRLLPILVLVAVAAAGGRVSVGALGGNDDRRAGSSTPARLVEVVDGDTLKVRVAGRRERVRLIGIDTPESVRPGTPVQCGAEAAARALRRRVRGERRVVLVGDPSQDARDRYDRLLAYAELPDGTDLGRSQVRAGWAGVDVYDHRPFRRLATYRRAARRARDERSGVNRACGGDFHRPQ